MRVHLSDVNEPPLFKANCADSDFVACYSINEALCLIGPDLNGVWSKLQVYDVDYADGLSVKLVGGNNFNNAEAFFLPFPSAIDGQNYLEETANAPNGIQKDLVHIQSNAVTTTICRPSKDTSDLAWNGWKTVPISEFSSSPNEYSYRLDDSGYVYDVSALSGSSECNSIIFSEIDDFSPLMKSQGIGKYGIFRFEAFVRVSSDWSGIDFQDLLHLSLWDENSINIGTISGGFPSVREAWAHCKVDISSNDVAVSHIIARLGWNRLQHDSVCPTLHNGMLEVYGLRVFLLESQIELRGSNIQFDYETKSTFILQIQVEDDSGLKSIGELIVHVIDVNEQPILTEHRFTVPESVGSFSNTIGTVISQDPDREKSAIWGTSSIIYNVLSQSSTNVVPNTHITGTSTMPNQTLSMCPL
jgi:hypothetical protein